MNHVFKKLLHKAILNIYTDKMTFRGRARQHKSEGVDSWASQPKQLH